MKDNIKLLDTGREYSRKPWASRPERKSMHWYYCCCWGCSGCMGALRVRGCPMKWICLLHVQKLTLCKGCTDILLQSWTFWKHGLCQLLQLQVEIFLFMTGLASWWVFVVSWGKYLNASDGFQIFPLSQHVLVFYMEQLCAKFVDFISLRIMWRLCM